MFHVIFEEHLVQIPDLTSGEVEVKSSSTDLTTAIELEDGKEYRELEVMSPDSYHSVVLLVLCIPFLLKQALEVVHSSGCVENRQEELGVSVEAGRQDRVWSVQVKNDTGLALVAKVEVVRKGWSLDMFGRERGQDALTDCM